MVVEHLVLWGWVALASLLVLCGVFTGSLGLESSINRVSGETLQCLNGEYVRTLEVIVFSFSIAASNPTRKEVASREDESQWWQSH